MKKILVVEDERSLGKVLFDVLTKNGYDVTMANDGQQGLVLSLSTHPDLILLDIVMPVMDGLTMLHRLRLDPWGKNVVVILLTNLSGTDKLSELKAEGVTDYLIKSDWSLNDIVKKVKDKLP